MTTVTKNQQWLDALKPGDKVGIYDYKGSTFLQIETVKKRTPTGRIVCITGNAYKADGYQIGSLSDRCLRPVPI